MHFGRVFDDILSHLRAKGRPTIEKLENQVMRIKKHLPQFSFSIGVDLEVESQKLIAILSFARAYLEVVYDHFPQFHHFKKEQQLSILLEVQTYYEKGFAHSIKCMKWVLSAPMAVHLMNKPPSKPQENLRLFPFSCGRVRHYFQKIIISRKSEKNLHFFTSLLQGVKRGCAPPPKEMVSKQLENHGKDLSKIPQPLDMDLKPKLRQILSGLKSLRVGHLKDTGGASYHTTRSLGGKMEEVIRLWNRAKFTEPIHNSCFLFMTSEKSFYGRDVPSWSQVRSMVGEVDVVKAIGLLEPLKVRVITTGDAATSCYLEPIRKKVHDLLREFDFFSPLGRPKVSESDLEVLLKKEANLGLKFTHWVSGDYAAATDNLNMNATLQCIEVICQMIGREEDIEILKSSLTRTQLKYPDPNLDCHQNNGQLMGNPMSFPILCLVNLIGYWLSLEKYLQHPVEIQSLPVLVNGDDILFRADQGFHDSWVDCISSLGFSLSVGKYYWHKRVATLNSQFFLCKETLDSSTGRVIKCDVKEVGYYNPGLLYKDYGYAGNKKKCHYLPVEQILSEYLKGVWSKERGWTQFKHYWGSTLDRASSGSMLNVFLPRSAGGLGAECHGVKYYVTKKQKHLAWMLYKLQNWQPSLAYEWTNCPKREVLNTDNCVIDYKYQSKTLLWLSEEIDETVLDKKLLKSGLSRTTQRIKYVPLDEFAEPTSQEVYPTFVMGSHLLSPDQIGLEDEQPYSLNLKRVVNHHSLVPLPELVKPSLDSSDLEPFTRKVKAVETGEQRLERSFTSEDRLWRRSISHRNYAWLRSQFGSRDEYPDPVSRRLYQFTGQLRCTEI